MRPPKRSAEKTSRNSFSKDEYDLAETGADRVVNRIIDNGLVIGADPVHLLERAVARTHACGEDQ